MLTLIEDLPQDVVGVEAHGKVTAEDYERVLVPAVDAARARAGGGGVRLLYASALAFSVSNSSCVIAPASSSSLAFAISAADPPPAVSRT